MMNKMNLKMIYNILDIKNTTKIELTIILFLFYCVYTKYTKISIDKIYLTLYNGSTGSVIHTIRDEEKEYMRAGALSI